MLRERRKERAKRDSDVDEAALAKTNAQKRQEQAPTEAAGGGLRGGAGVGGIMDKLTESNNASGFAPIDRTKGMANALDSWSDSEDGESSECEEDGDFQPRRKVGDKRLPGSSRQTSLAVGENDGADEGEVGTSKIWTVYAQTTSHIEEDADVSFEEELEAALSDASNDATHQTHAAPANADNDDLFGDSTLPPDEAQNPSP